MCPQFHAFHYLAEMLRRHRSAKLLDQTAAEAVQQRVHRTLASVNGYARRGRLSKVVQAKSARARKAFLDLREEHRIDEAEFVYDSLLHGFIADNSSKLDVPVKLREANMIIKWEEYCSSWRAWVCLTRVRNRWVAHSKRSRNVGYSRLLLEDWAEFRQRLAHEGGSSARAWWRAQATDPSRSYCRQQRPPRVAAS